VQKNGLAQVLAFDVLEEHLFKLLQISVSSDDETITYLVVSKSCSDVQQLGVGITSHSIRMKEIKLTFTKYGRITLSQYSSPKIETGRWYIGMLVKEGSVDNIDEKAVNVSITQTYSYDSIGKGLPVLYMCLITGLLGLIVAVFAHFFLNSDFEEMATPLYMEDGVIEQGKNRTSPSYPDKTILDFIPPPIPRKSFPFKCWLRVVFVHWFGRGTKTYSYLTVVLAVSFLVGSAQFVIGRWSNMISTGDRDKCYYNDRCYRPIAVADLPSNFMISNVPYCLHGVILALAFSFREAVNVNHRGSQASFNLQGTHKLVPYDFSLAYALSWALVFEGLFSATYHLCPSRLTFQFDSAFMFIISGLVVVALFNARVEIIRNSEGRPPSETIVQAPKYFLFFVAPLLVLNYVGSIRDTDGLPRFVEVFYWIVLVMWLVFVYIWAFLKVGISVPGSGPGLSNRCGCSTAEDRVKWFWMVLVPICLFIIGMAKFRDWSQFFLFSCVAAVVLTIGGLMSFSMIATFRRHQYQATYHPLAERDQSMCDIKGWCLKFAKNIHRLIFVVVLFLFWVFAMYFFKLKPTAKKTALPSESRTFNDECVLWEFFDYHDIWHMLSSVALLMSAFLLIYITRSVEKHFWVEASYKHSKDNTNSKITAKPHRNASAQSLDKTCESNPNEEKDIHMSNLPRTDHEEPSADEGKVTLRKEIQTSQDRDLSRLIPRPRSRVETLV
jgi:hypothetical protein